MPISFERADQLLAVPFTFTERPTPAPGELRPVWRVPLVLLMTRACRGQRANRDQLHLLNWALRSSEGRRTLLSTLEYGVAPDRPLVRYEPAMDRALALARGLGLLQLLNGTWRLTDAAEHALQRLDLAEAFEAERAVLDEVSPLTQTAVRRLLDRARLSLG